MAISGLPPFNGFVSEFLIYIGSFNGVALGTLNFALSLMAIVSLAIIGGLALACFTKVVGVVFQGEPRCPAARDADEKGITMLIPMLALAAVCIGIGVFPTLCMPFVAKAVGSMGLGYGNIPVTPFIDLTANITRTAILVLAVFLTILVLRAISYRNKTITQSGTWGCGFTQPTVRMQYTGASYAASILEFFKPVAPLSETRTVIKSCFPSTTHYHSHVNDIAEMQLGRIIVTPVMALFDKLRWLQHGDIHLYIGYILLAIVALLFFV